ncbi:MAG: hypothetical protein GEU76_16495 [Alphaproteobacteria bacterium]|nr:hypothetical protein [Alphaproteobacteria bacterium]
MMLLGGCSIASELLFPSLEEEPKAPAGASSSAASAPSQATTPKSPPTSATGTTVGARVAQLRNDLTGLQASVNQHNANLAAQRKQIEGHVQRYRGTVANIHSRLQPGTTRGNPELMSQWNAAQIELDGISRAIAEMSAISAHLAGNAATARYLLQNTRAAKGLTGAVEEDHRQLATLENELNRTSAQIERLVTDVSQDIARQATYIGNERQNLTRLSAAVKDGVLPGAPVAGTTDGVAPAPRRPLVVIRFDRPDVAYDKALYSAVNSALEHKPEAVFDLVAVAPGAGSASAAANATAAQRNAESVLRSLTAMGLPASRVTLSAGTSAEAKSSEVHIYVR